MDSARIPGLARAPATRDPDPRRLNSLPFAVSSRLASSEKGAWE